MFNIFKWFWSYNLPRWFILLIDVGICAFSLGLSFFIRFYFEKDSMAPLDKENIPYDFAIVLGIRLISFIISKTHKGVVRYTSSKDATRIFLVVIIGTVVISLVNLTLFYTGDRTYIIPNSIIIIDALVTLFLMISSRLAIKALFLETKNPASERMNVIIFGAGEAGIITKRTLDRDAAIKYRVVAFVDDDDKKKGRSLEGAFIYTTDKLGQLIKDNNAEIVIISIQNLSAAKKNEITDICLNYNTRVLNVPPPTKWINGELSFNQLKTINIEDLLEREPIKLDADLISEQIKGKVIMITGAAGSIGSELARQCMKFEPKRIFLVDQAESPLHELELEFADKYKKESFEVALADVRNLERMQKAFEIFKPNIVFHAAAYKHVPLMENNPSESVFTNVLGTKVCADLSVEHQVEKFVFVSTDKAVNPTNVMGASKRIAEIYIQSLGKKSKTRFITTRFGNVLGSNGSVIPRFKKQIESGGPVTITHPDITRYFMTIPEACQLVLEAGCMGKGGEIFVFDMGKSVKIIDLARKMIKLSGLQEEKDIKIKVTGLRPGEKLFEELLADAENTLPTHHSQILIGKVREYEYNEVNQTIESIIKLFNTQNNELIVKHMKTIVPEYKSNNSVFEKLDKK